ncbi:MAG: TonB-dependent receptor plug domain-containing protein, partial [Bacteroidota bacterium]
LTGHFSAYIPIHPEEIDRIEILNGAAAAIHGSDAVGGVIHIITKTFSAKEQQSKHAYSAGIEAGQYGQFNSNSWWRMKSKNTSLSAGIFSNNAEGQPLRGTSGYFHSTAASIAFSHQFKHNWFVSLRSATDIRNFNAQNFYTTFVSDTASEKVNSFWQQIHIKKTFKNWEWRTEAAFKKLSDEFSFRPHVSPNLNKTSLFVAQTYGVIKTGKYTSITSGLQYFYKSIESNDRGNHTLPHAAGFVTANHKLGNTFFITGSMRLDWDGNYGAVIIPQLNFAWNPSRFTLRGSWGKGIRDADFTERYNNYNKAIVTSGSIGNPNLHTERSQNVELGADYRAIKGVKLSAGLFQRQQYDLIDWTPTPFTLMPRQSNLVPNGSYALATNLSNVTTHGAEIDLQIKRTLKKGELMWMSGWLWLNSKTQDKTPSFYISSHARFLLTNMVIIQSGSFNFSISTINKVRNTMNSSALNTSISRTYMLTNIKAQYRISKSNISIFGQCYNLFNTSFSDLLGAKMPGRWLSAGLTFRSLNKN